MKLKEPRIRSAFRIRNMIMVLVGIFGLILKKWFLNSVSDMVYSYVGNITVSYAVYFLINIGTENRLNRFKCFFISLAIVEIFEFTDGFGIMTNVYDPFDYLANIMGITLAFIVDAITKSVILSRQLKEKKA